MHSGYATVEHGVAETFEKKTVNLLNEDPGDLCHEENQKVRGRLARGARGQKVSEKSRGGVRLGESIQLLFIERGPSLRMGSEARTSDRRSFKKRVGGGRKRLRQRNKGAKISEGALDHQLRKKQGSRCAWGGPWEPTVVDETRLETAAWREGRVNALRRSEKGWEAVKISW